MPYDVDTITYVWHDREWVVAGLLSDPEREPWLYAHLKAEVRVGRGALFGSEDVIINGLLREAYFEIPDTVVGGTATLILRTEDQGIVLNSGALAVNAIHTVAGNNRILMGRTTLIAQCGAAQVATQQLGVVLRVERLK